MYGRNLLSWSRLARLALKNSLGQKAANELSSTKTQMKTYPVGLAEVADEVPFEDRTDYLNAHNIQPLACGELFANCSRPYGSPRAGEQLP